MRRWTLVTLIVLMALLAVVAVYQIQLAGRRGQLERDQQPTPTPTG
ncbi:MAG TPA: hypothetical protein VE962_00740 [Actinomycetota bacterium]|jgi:hypothetical protein|nr:hypothetical protein [Actinomycetota bacterium]